ncbi:alpha/beta fold hydrolase [Sphingobium lactosutens]|nr:alpha/beta hydrolase [Sphingobium lactosutens]
MSVSLIDDLAVLPGLMCDSRMFTQALPDALFVDGFYGGANSLPDMARYSLSRLPSRFAVLGHSMGGRVALEIIRMAPERVSALILSSTGVHPVQPNEAEKRFALLDIGRQQGIEALVDQWLPPMIAPDRRNDSDWFAPLKSMCVDAGLATYEAQMTALLSRPELDDLLPTVACPTLVMTGELDQWSPPAQHQAIAAAIPGASLHIVEGAGHMLPAEQPDMFGSVIQTWLAQTG